MPVAAAGRAWGRGQMRRESGGVAREHAAAREAGKGDGGMGRGGGSGPEMKPLASRAPRRN